MTDADTPRPTPRALASAVRRCPACGQKLVTPSPFSCPLCEYIFGDDSITGNDITPYAKAYARQWSGRRRMCEWVWYAGAGRMKHVALIRASAASRHFWLTTCIVLSLSAGLFQATRFSFCLAQHVSITETTSSPAPKGNGWLSISKNPDTSQSSIKPTSNQQLWCSPALLIIVTSGSSVFAFVLCMIVTLLGRSIASKAHGVTHQSEMRMGAAIHYSAAWSIPIILGLLIASLRPIALVSQVDQWSWRLPTEGFDLAGGVLATFGATMWWFWLVRLAVTAPSAVRSRVVLSLSILVPAITVGAVALWWIGLEKMFYLFTGATGLQF